MVVSGLPDRGLVDTGAEVLDRLSEGVVGGKRPDFENYDFSTMKKAVEWLRENGFAPA